MKQIILLTLISISAVAQNVPVTVGTNTIMLTPQQVARFSAQIRAEDPTNAPLRMARGKLIQAAQRTTDTNKIAQAIQDLK
jgi:hypothetical protein